MFEPKTAPLERDLRVDGRYIVTAPFSYTTKEKYKITVCEGFPTDLASIPRMIRLFIQVNGRHSDAAIIHDWLYYKKGHAVCAHFSREECDDIFYDAMIYSHVPQWKAYLMWAGVRLGGWAAWSNK